MDCALHATWATSSKPEGRSALHVPRTATLATQVMPAKSALLDSTSAGAFAPNANLIVRGVYLELLALLAQPGTTFLSEVVSRVLLTAIFVPPALRARAVICATQARLAME
jgi:hypothetical protein